MKWVLIGLGVLAVLAIAGLIFVRTASHDPARWHVDPATVTEVDSMNQYRRSEVLPASPDDVAAALSDVLDGEVLAGDLDVGFATFVIRTPLVGYPDYVSVRVAAEDDQTKVTIFSRSRFGRSDMGANKARVDAMFLKLLERFGGIA